MDNVIEVPVDSSPVDAGETRGEQPPQTPAPTRAVDPESFNQGAQEVPGTQASPQAPTEQRVFTADEVENFRRQERDKLYGKIDSMETELRTMRESRESEQRERSEAEKRIIEESTKAAEGDLDVRELLVRKEEEWTERFNRIEQEREADRALLEKEREFAALQEFKRSQLDTHADDIMPQLRDLVEGNSESEILSAIETAKSKTADILANVAAAQQSQRQQVPTARVTQPSSGGPMEATEQMTRTYSSDDIAAMSMKEYSAKRNEFLRAAGNRGPYRP